VIRLHFTPPDSDDAWDAWIADGRAAVARMLAGAADRRAIDAALYKRQRDRLLMVTHQKCAYCELRLPAGQRKGDVEHYRPKGRVRRMDGKAVKVQEVAREFGVEYVLEGSVRKAGDRIRVTVQLIDAETDRHIWAERYDRNLEDIFAIQDEMTRAIVATLPGRVEAATHDRAKRKPTDNMAAYECVLTAKVLHHRSIREDNAEAQRLLDRAIALDPNYAHAHAWKGCVLGQMWTYGWCADRDAAYQQVAAELEIAQALDDNDSDVHRILAALSLNRNEHDKAAYHQERALALDVQDEGVVDLSEEIFERGWSDRGGQGIGLALGRDLATSQGGRLLLSPGRPGTVFTVLLPATPDDAHLR